MYPWVQLNLGMPAYISVCQDKCLCPNILVVEDHHSLLVAVDNLVLVVDRHDLPEVDIPVVDNRLVPVEDSRHIVLVVVLEEADHTDLEADHRIHPVVVHTLLVEVAN